LGISEADFKCFLWMLVSFADLAARLLAWRIRLPEQAAQSDIRFLARFGKSSSYGALGRRVCSSALQQLIRIDVDGHGDVFGKWQFVQRFADEAA